MPSATFSALISIALKSGAGGAAGAGGVWATEGSPIWVRGRRTIVMSRQVDRVWRRPIMGSPGRERDRPPQDAPRAGGRIARWGGGGPPGGRWWLRLASAHGLVAHLVQHELRGPPRGIARERDP